MGMFDNVFGGGGSKQVSSGPEQSYVNAGKEIYGASKNLAGRDYPTYDAARVANFTQDQNASFDMTRNNVGSWNPSFQQAFQSGMGGVAPIGASDISQYMNPYTDQVIAGVTNDMNRQATRDTIGRHASMAGRGSYLNEDRRGVMDNLAQESNNRNLASVIGNLRQGAFKDAIQQANTDRQRQFAGSQLFGNLGVTRQQLGAMDAGSMAAAGGMQQAQDQQNLSLRYQDFQDQFRYPQEQANWLMAQLQGQPHQNTSPQAQPNPWAQGIGMASAIGGMGGSFGWW